jgi:hypothetical protein
MRFPGSLSCSWGEDQESGDGGDEDCRAGAGEGGGRVSTYLAAEGKDCSGGTADVQVQVAFTPDRPVRYMRF